jgi:hypothetical protein
MFLRFHLETVKIIYPINPAWPAEAFLSEGGLILSNNMIK